jgi:hypothetical protein
MLDRIPYFNIDDYSTQEWRVAMHEAAHYVAAVGYGYRIFGVELAVTNRRDRMLGRVKILDEDKMSDLVITAAGPMMDKQLYSEAELLNDKGFHHEVKRVAVGAQNALGDYYHEMYCGAELPTREQLQRARDEIDDAAHTIVTECRDIIETVAKAFLISRSKSTGKIARTKLAKITLMTKERLKGG